MLTYLTTCLIQLGYQQCLADACDFRSEEEGRAANTAVIHEDDIIPVGRKSRCDYFCDDLCRVVSVKNLGDLCWYGGCQLSRDQLNGLLKASQKTFAD